MNSITQKVVLPDVDITEEDIGSVLKQGLRDMKNPDKVIAICIADKKVF